MYVLKTLILTRLHSTCGREYYSNITIIPTQNPSVTSPLCTVNIHIQNTRLWSVQNKPKQPNILILLATSRTHNHLQLRSIALLRHVRCAKMDNWCSWTIQSLGGGKTTHHLLFIIITFIFK